METPSHPTLETQRIISLDGFRGLAILMVTLYRFASISFTPEVVGKLPSKVIFIGAAGVDFFFVLSGFLITDILLKSRGRPHYFSTFYINRSLRIFPLYYATLLLLLVILPWLGKSEIRDGLEGHPVHLWLYTTNLSVSWENAWVFGSLDHFWTLAIEEQFYLIWPLMVCWLAPQRLIRSCWVLFFSFAALRIGCSLGGIGNEAERAFTLFRLDGLLLGSIGAILVHESKPIIANFRLLRRLFAFAFAAYIASLALGEKDLTLRYTIVALVAILLLLQTLASPASSLERKFFEHRALRSLGKYSYAMYVFQNPLIPLLEPILTHQSLASQLGNPLLAAFVYVVIMFSITYFLAVVSWHCFEKWFMLLRQRITSNLNKPH